MLLTYICSVTILNNNGSRPIARQTSLRSYTEKKWTLISRRPTFWDKYQSDICVPDNMILQTGSPIYLIYKR